LLPGEETVAFAPSASFDEVDGSLPITEKGVILLWGEFIVFFVIDDSIADWNRNIITAGCRFDSE